MFYLILDRNDCWGSGQTIEDALNDACEWICDDSGQQGVTLDWLKARITSQAESRNGDSGFYVYPVNEDYPEDAEKLDGQAWINRYYK